VIESWRTILRGVRPNAFKLSLEGVRVFALSETHGLVTCVEVIDADESTGRCGWGDRLAGLSSARRAAGLTTPARPLLLLLPRRTVATNLFELQDGKWVITLHQGGPLMSRFR
jgi:hypothetical protein